MIGKRTEDARIASLAEVKELLEARSVQPDFGYEQQTSLDYSKKFAKTTKAEADEMIGKLMGIDGMKLEGAIKLADIMPSIKAQIAPIVAKEKISLSDASCAKVLEIVNSYRKQI